MNWVASIFAIISMLGFGCLAIFIKLASRSASVGVVTLVFQAVSLILIFSYFIVFDERKIANNSFIFWAILAGVCGGIATIFYFLAIKQGQIHSVTPIRHLAFLIAVILAVILLGEKITLVKGIGIGLAAAAVILLAL